MNRSILFFFIVFVLTNKAAANPIIFENARFTVITPQLIRMEYDENKIFLNDPTYFAKYRGAKTTNFTVVEQDNEIVISTEAFTLHYVSDGQPFHSGNLHAKVHDGLPFIFGRAPQLNLGGTLESLDGITGPIDLDEGILTKDGWYLVDDSSAHVFTDDWIAAKKRPSSDYYLFAYGKSYQKALEALSTISGKVPLPRKYALGSWYSRYWPYSSADYQNIVQEYHHFGFPLDVLVLDMDWHRAGWTGWSWNHDLIPEPKSLLSWLAANKIAVTLNLHPSDGVKPHEDAYSDFMQSLGKDPSNQTTIPFDAANKQYMGALFSQVHDPLIQDGVNFWWLDWQQERYTRSLPTLRNIPWLNHLYFTESEKKENLRGLSFSRYGGLGDQRHPLHFSGDASTDFAMLGFEVAFNSLSASSGIYFWTHDMGGHQGKRNEESFARWVQFGATTAALRLHSTRSPELDRRPWTYSQPIMESLRKSFTLRSRLFPYIYTAAWKAHEYNRPLNTPLYFTNQEALAYQLSHQYFWGNDFLVAPIVKKSQPLGEQAVWFPPVQDQALYYDYFSGVSYPAGSQAIVLKNLNEFPLFVMGGKIIPTQEYKERMGSTTFQKIRLEVFPGIDNAPATTSELYDDDGLTTGYLNGEYQLTRFHYRQATGTVEIEIEPSQGSYGLEGRHYEVLLRNMKVKGSKGKFDSSTNASIVDLGWVAGNQGLKIEIAVEKIPDSLLSDIEKQKNISLILDTQKNLPLQDFSHYYQMYKESRLSKGQIQQLAMIFGIGAVKNLSQLQKIQSVNNLQIFTGELKQSQVTIEARSPNGTKEGKEILCNHTCVAQSGNLSLPNYPYVGRGAEQFVRIKGELKNKEEIDLEFEINRTPTFLSNWQAIGPFAYDRQKPLADQKSDFPKFPMDLNSKHENKNGSFVSWQSTRSQHENKLDFNSLFYAPNSIAFALGKLQNPILQQVTFKVASDDGVEMWLDGAKILSKDVARPLGDGDEIVVNLDAGEHEILFKVSNLDGDFALRVEVESSQPILESSFP